jgi:F0F1-type ATP synthase assembly protein I
LLIDLPTMAMDLMWVVANAVFGIENQAMWAVSNVHNAMSMWVALDVFAVVIWKRVQELASMEVVVAAWITN